MSINSRKPFSQDRKIGNSRGGFKGLGHTMESAGACVNLGISSTAQKYYMLGLLNNPCEVGSTCNMFKVIFIYSFVN